MNKRKRPFFNFICAAVRLFFRKRRFIGVENIPTEASIIVGNHAQLHGPLTAQLRFCLDNRYIWCQGAMLSHKEVPSYAMSDFFRYKRRGLWLYRLISRIIARPVEYIFSRADVIGVYHDARAVRTARETLGRLNEGNHIIIFPECHTEWGDIVNEFADGFIDIARLFFLRYGRALAFVPMYNAPSLRTVVFGKAIYYNPELDGAACRDAIREYLKAEITSLARSLPTHTVTPYANISRSRYPSSR